MESELEMVLQAAIAAGMTAYAFDLIDSLEKPRPCDAAGEPFAQPKGRERALAAFLENFGLRA